MHVSRNRVAAGALVAAVCALLAAATLPAHAAGATYYVALSGDDANSGTQAAPFRTIQKAATVAQAGDTVVVRAGTYRETVTPAHAGTASSPIIFKPSPGERVVVSGADLVTSWTPIAGSIYAASNVAGFSSTSNQAEQVFVDGQMLNLAQFPNTTLDQSHRTMAKLASIIADDGKRATIGDPSLSQAADYWNGATIHFSTNLNYQDVTGTIVASSPGQVTFDYTSTDGTRPVVDADYYLFGKRAALDAAGEWFRDPSSSTLDIWTPQSDNPVSHTVEVKQRDYAFNLDGKSYITVQGFTLFAATITTDTGAGDGKGAARQGTVASANHIVIDGISASYLSHFTDLTAFAYSQWSNNTGIILSGSDNLLQNSTLAYSAGNGVSVLGDRNRVLNNTIHDVNYAACECGGISTGFQNTHNLDHEIGYNTIFTSGRFLISTRSLKNGPAQTARVHHNVLHESDLQTEDAGAYYVTWNGDGAGMEIDHNIAYNNHDRFGGVGIYLDGNTKNYRIHHNVVWDSGNGMTLNGPSNIELVNNTLLGDNYSIYFNGSVGADVVLTNNIFTKPLIHEGNATQASNLATSAANAKFADAAAHNYQLQAGSPAINAGVTLPAYTDDTRAGSTAVTDGKPDQGAYEYGQVVWSAGQQTASPPSDSTATPAPTCAPTATPAPTGTPISDALRTYLPVTVGGSFVNGCS